MWYNSVPDNFSSRDIYNHCKIKSDDQEMLNRARPYYYRLTLSSDVSLISIRLEDLFGSWKIGPTADASLVGARVAVAIPSKDRHVLLYEKMGYRDIKPSSSDHGGMQWHEMMTEL
ncbi:hypothetical protein [Rhizobium sp. BR 249]|uniref:hypothetical protein n=1 Tax=Rhizobium sp. BR 249 TaxID=3040011 RepID=UPI0039BF3583